MRRGFTLMEVLVSVMIFSVVSIALISVLVGAVRIFRSGESARAAQDDAMTVIAQLDEDLNRMVPPGDGGFLYLREGQFSGGAFATDPLCNMILAFKIRNPDQLAVSRQVTAIAGSADSDAVGAHLIVCWFVKDGWLNRTTVMAADSDGDNSTTSELDKTAAALAITTGHVSMNCLYFGADASLDQPLAGGTVSIRQSLEWTGCLPLNDDKFCTEPDAGGVFQPFPRALRISLTLTGGSRHLTQGNVVGSNGSGGIRTSGIAQFPVGTGGIARLLTSGSDAAEWIHFDLAANGVLTLAGGRPASIRRSTQLAAGPGMAIQLAPTYCVTRTLPR